MSLFFVRKPSNVWDIIIIKVVLFNRRDIKYDLFAGWCFCDTFSMYWNLCVRHWDLNLWIYEYHYNHIIEKFLSVRKLWMFIALFLRLLFNWAIDFHWKRNTYSTTGYSEIKYWLPRSLRAIKFELRTRLTTIFSYFQI